MVGSAAISGFLDALRNGGGWDLDRRLVARPFPQPLAGTQANNEQWTSLRRELARQSGIVIFLGGAKVENGKIITASGVLEEFFLARAAGAFLLPVAATGGAAREVSDQLLGSPLSASGADAVRPTDAELRQLSDPKASVDALAGQVFNILKRVIKSA